MTHKGSHAASDAPDGDTELTASNRSSAGAIHYDQRPAERIAAEEIVKEECALIRRHRGNLYRYQQKVGFWSPWSEVEVRSRAMSILKRIYVIQEREDGRQVFYFRWGTASQARNTVAVIEAQVLPFPCEALGNVIVFGNGTYSVKEACLQEHSHENYATYGIDADFVESAECPQELRRSIHTCYGVESEPIIRACIRQLIDPSVPYGQAFHFLGRSGGGKGTLIEFFQSLFSHDLVTDLAHPAQIDNPDRLYQFVLGRRLVVFPDCPAHAPAGAGAGTLSTFYKLIENAPLTTRKLHSSESHTSPLDVRCILGSTQPLSLGRDAKTGFARRVLTIRVRDAEGRVEQDPTLKDDLLRSKRARQIRSEAVSWALAMPKDEVLAVLARNDPEGLLRDAAADAEIAGDSVSQFADQCLTPHPDGPNAEVTAEDLAKIYESYCGWCKHSNVGHPMQRFNFQGQLRQTLGGGRCLPRRKESRIEARAAGRDRHWIPSLDAGFALIRGLLPEDRPIRDAFNPAFIGTGKLVAIRSQPPVERSATCTVGTGPGGLDPARGHGRETGPKGLQQLGGPLGTGADQDVEQSAENLRHCTDSAVASEKLPSSLHGKQPSLGPVPTPIKPEPRLYPGFQGRNAERKPVPTSSVPMQQALLFQGQAVGSGADVFDVEDDPAWGPRP